jgi:toxin ParE1/3/4
MAGPKWHIRVGAAAELDFANILKWTAENFGPRQAQIYREALVEAIGELANGPDVNGSKSRDDIIHGIRSLHIAGHGHRGRHFLIYRVTPGRIIEIGRIMHDRMDLRRHQLFAIHE